MFEVLGIGKRWMKRWCCVVVEIQVWFSLIRAGTAGCQNSQAPSNISVCLQDGLPGRDSQNSSWCQPFQAGIPAPRALLCWASWGSCGCRNGWWWVTTGFIKDFPFLLRFPCHWDSWMVFSLLNYLERVLKTLSVCWANNLIPFEASYFCTPRLFSARAMSESQCWARWKCCVAAPLGWAGLAPGDSLAAQSRALVQGKVLNTELVGWILGLIVPGSSHTQNSPLLKPP